MEGRDQLQELWGTSNPVLGSITSHCSGIETGLEKTAEIEPNPVQKGGKTCSADQVERLGQVDEGDEQWTSLLTALLL